MKAKRPVNITDHALIRWIERARGIDLTLMREEIRDTVQDAMDAGATAVVVKGIEYRMDPKTRAVLTVVER